jgi:hypothetical protein
VAVVAAAKADVLAAVAAVAVANFSKTHQKDQVQSAWSFLFHYPR